MSRSTVGRDLVRGLGFWVLLALAGAASAAQLPDFTGLVEAYGPAVVNISTTQKAKRVHPKLPEGVEIPDLPEGTPFGDFLRRFFGDDDTQEFDAKSLGSGFIVSADGYIVTNSHVVADADVILVRLQDGREMRAKVVGSDPRSDIAVLKIDADRLPAVKIGNSENLKVGEWVAAIGSPFGFDNSVTAGIVSAKGRSLPSENYVPFIQTDVAINRGNSGGPLFNLSGEVVGVNSQIYSRTGGFMGLSFSIPINVAMDVVAQLKSRGHVSRGWLGVLIQDVTRELAESFGMEKPQGALVAQVVPDSPAAAAGVQVGDIVIAFDGHEIKKFSELPPIVGLSRVGETVDLKIIRNGEARSLQVKIAELPPEEGIKLAGVAPRPGVENRLGLEVSALTAEQRKTLEVEQGGVVVTEVQDGPAQSAGIHKGDVVVMINNERVKDVAQFGALVKSLPPGKAVPVLVRRSTGPLFLALKLPRE
jgi:serine protease Do